MKAIAPIAAEILGFAAIVAAGWLIAIPLGLFLFGSGLIVAVNVPRSRQ